MRAPDFEIRGSHYFLADKTLCSIGIFSMHSDHLENNSQEPNVLNNKKVSHGDAIHLFPDTGRRENRLILPERGNRLDQDITILGFYLV